MSFGFMNYILKITILFYLLEYPQTSYHLLLRYFILTLVLTNLNSSLNYIKIKNHSFTTIRDY